MKIVIIEDEKIASADLQQTILELDPAIEVVAILTSVTEGIEWFSNNPAPDLIFSDIELGDGLSFEILEHLKVPVIFCTAYDEYALNAFRANGIDYILKPFNLLSVSTALQKYKNLSGIRQEDMLRQYHSIQQLLSASKSQKVSSLLIYHKDYVFPLATTEIALLYVENEVVTLITFNGSTYYPGKSLEELETALGDDFFRANRQYLIHRKAIVKASSLLSRKLSLTLSVDTKDIVTLSREKAPVFLKWLAGKG